MTILNKLSRKYMLSPNYGRILRRRHDYCVSTCEAIAPLTCVDAVFRVCIDGGTLYLYFCSGGYRSSYTYFVSHRLRCRTLTSSFQATHTQKRVDPLSRAEGLILFPLVTMVEEPRYDQVVQKLLYGYSGRHWRVPYENSGQKSSVVCK